MEKRLNALKRQRIHGKPIFRSEGPRFYDEAYARNERFAKPAGDYQTDLKPHQEKRFEKWVRRQDVPFDAKAKTVDYDMRGWWKRHGSKPYSAGTHFSDKFKTPYDTTFSRESKYASKDNPYVWKGDKLVNRRNSRLIFKPKKDQ